MEIVRGTVVVKLEAYLQNIRDQHCTQSLAARVQVPVLEAGIHDSEEELDSPAGQILANVAQREGPIVAEPVLLIIRAIPGSTLRGVLIHPLARALFTRNRLPLAGHAQQVGTDARVGANEQVCCVLLPVREQFAEGLQAVPDLLGGLEGMLPDFVPGEVFVDVAPLGVLLEMVPGPSFHGLSMDPSSTHGD